MKFARRALVAVAGMWIWTAMAAGQMTAQKPEMPVEKWTGKTIMLIGAHARRTATRCTSSP